RSAMSQFRVAVGAVLVLACLMSLLACQGVSTGGSNQEPVGSLVLENTSLDFGNVTLNTTKTLTVTATNSGENAVTINGASTSTKYFALASPTPPVSVVAGGSITLSISFTPNSSTTFSATLTVTSDATNSPASVSLAGTGVSTTSPQLSV